jgi:hypothetical protein
MPPQELRDQLGLHDPANTPQMGESLEAFFRRTVGAWAKQAGTTLGAGDVLSGKQLRRRAFDLARVRYEELFAVLEELNELDAEQTRLEQQLKSMKRPGGGGGGGGAGGPGWPGGLGGKGPKPGKGGDGGGKGGGKDDKKGSKPRK